MSDVSPARAARWWIALVAALLLLNASVTFQNVWPTPFVRWLGEWSIELAACTLVFAAIAARRGAVPRGIVRLTAVLWVFFIVGRYADVTAPAVFGRPINLYWDSRHLRAVGEMLATAASFRIVAVAIIAAVGVPLLLYWPARWALGRLADASAQRGPRRVLVAAAAVVVLLFLVSPLTTDIRYVPRVAASVTRAYGQQGTLFLYELTTGNAREVAASPPMTPNLVQVADTDVFLVFIESYGAVTYDRPDLAAGLRESRQQFARDVDESGRRVVSAFVTSPTFGGSSWLAHITLLSGIDVRDEDTNIKLMAQKRETMVSAFARRGFRTLALMPGLQAVWPEGSFYGFDALYRGNELGYKGPDFGWWSVPDQFSIARLDDLELRSPSRAPAFAFFPTITTHAPFSPVAPYQPDWQRVLTSQPYDSPDVENAFNHEPDWFDLGPSYVRSIAYDFAALGGYLRLRAGHGVVMVLIGDHQPPSAVSGEGMRWDVPVHVVSSRPEILDRLVAQGFVPGLTPAAAPIARMHELTTMLFDAFSGPEPGESTPYDSGGSVTGSGLSRSAR